MDTISIGKHNPRLADIRKAIQRDTLTADGLLVIEGPTLVREAEASGLAITTLFLRDGTSAEGLPRASTVYSLDAPTFRSIQATEHSQGVIALVRPRSWTLDEILTGRLSTMVVLAGLQDPGNVGTILRVAESFGAAGCLALVGTVAIHNSKVTRASAGSVFRLPHVWNLDLQTVVAAFKAKGVPIVGTSPHSSQSIAAWDWSEPVGVLIGNEGAGLTRDQSAACAAMLRIPHERATESLNSAIAAAVVLYEAYRRRHLP
ncbi:MAG TPA: RNA methyltransferase [Terriglobia bacterium]|nr:RNA methyltransferase [Terriglobia bacterium]